MRQRHIFVLTASNQFEDAIYPSICYMAYAVQGRGGAEEMRGTPWKGRQSVHSIQANRSTQNVIHLHIQTLLASHSPNLYVFRRWQWNHLEEKCLLYRETVVVHFSL